MLQRSPRTQSIAVLLLFLFIAVGSANAQLVITANQTANVLAQKLVGTGVSVTNPVLTCASGGSGSFKVITSNLGLDSGIVLTSGQAKTNSGSSIQGVDGAASSNASYGNGTSGDAQLNTLAGQTTYDACILEFDFVPSGDSIRFNYVFGSEEYPEYNCSSFNDVFGFFISGAGITGSDNMALVPGTTIPVSINSINSGVSGGSYSISTCNQMGAGAPFPAYYVNNTGSTVVYDGFTTVLTARHNVIPCSTYHLKLAIADAADGILDSGVFLKAGSFTSSYVNVTSQGANNLTAPLPYCVRGCAPGKFLFTRPVANATPLTIHYDVLGTAVNGTDYTTIPDTVIIPANATSTYRNIYALSMPPTGVKTVKLRIYSPYSCQTNLVVDSATLSIYDSFQVNILTPDTTICNGASVQINVQGDTQLTYNWTPVATLNNANIKSPIATPTATTTYVLTISYPAPGCAPVNKQITISMNAPPSMSNNTFNYCQNATASQLTATGIGVKWYTTPSGGVGSTIAPTPSTSTPGTFYYYVSQTIAGCESGRATVTVNVTGLPAAPAVTSPVNYCLNATASPLTATGSNLKWYTGPSGGTGSTTAPTPSTTTAGGTNYYVSQTINGCESPRAMITVNVSPAVSAPAVTSPVTYCQFVTTAQLTASGSNLLWYTNASGGTGSSTAPTPNSSSANTTNYYVSQTVGSCESSRSMIAVTVYAKPANPGVTSPVGYCQFNTATPLTASGSNLKWYTAASGGTGSTSAPTPSTAAPGSVSYYVSQTVNGCESDRSQIVVNITVKPVAPSVLSNQTYCQGATPTPLVASGQNLLWYANASGGTGSSATPTPSTAVAGNTFYYVSQTVAGCESDRAQITVSITAQPAPPVPVTPVSYCQNVIAVPLTANGSNLLWYTAATGGSGTSTTPTPSTASAGTTYHYVSQTVNGCESNRAQLSVVIHPIPAPPAVNTPVLYCQYNSSSPLIATGSNILWYLGPTGGTGSQTAPTPATGNAGNNNYYVSQTANGCESNRAQIVVTVNPQPAMPATSTSLSYCQFDGTTALSASGQNIKWYTTLTGGTGTSTAPQPSSLSPGTFYWYVTQTISGCESERQTITVIIKPKPAPPTLTTPLHYCQYDANPPALGGLGQNLKWYENPVGGPGSSLPPIPNTSYQDTLGWWVTQTVNGCESDRFLQTVIVNYKPNGIIIAKKPFVCQYESDTFDYFGNATPDVDINWKVPLGQASITYINKFRIVVRFDSAGVVPIRMQVSNHGCVSPEYTLMVDVHPVPIVRIATKPEICFDEYSLITLDYATPNITGYQWDFGGGKELFGAAGGGPYGLQWPAPGNYTVRVKVSARDCTSPYYTHDVIVHALPDGRILSASTQELCAGDTAILTAASKQNGTYRYEWTPSVYFNDGLGADIMQDVVWAKSTLPKHVHLIVTDINGCKAGDSLFISAKPCCEVYLPDAFTPNSDGRNDVFRVITVGHHDISVFRIVDRWGKTVFETADEGQGWDGKLGGRDQEVGTYFYYIKYQCVNKEYYEQKGALTLVR